MPDLRTARSKLSRPAAQHPSGGATRAAPSELPLSATGDFPRVAAPRIVSPTTADPGAAPIDANAFEALMAPLGPFEPAPRVAVAVSGGSDSLALCLLADRWARARGGTVFGLTVDHRLRLASGAEAAQVRRWLAAHAISHRTSALDGHPPCLQDSGGGAGRTTRAARRLVPAGSRPPPVARPPAGGSGRDGAAATRPR